MVMYGVQNSADVNVVNDYENMFNNITTQHRLSQSTRMKLVLPGAAHETKCWRVVMKICKNIKNE